MMNASADFQKLLELAVHEEHEFLEAHQRRVQFYSSLISAVLAATVAGAMNAKEGIHYILLLTGPVLVVALSVIALGGTFRLYQRFLEAVVTRAKIEQRLQLHKQVQDENQEYWKGEALLVSRHLNARRQYPDSQAFLDQHRHAGYQRYTRRLFVTFALVGGGIGVLLLFAAAKPWL